MSNRPTLEQTAGASNRHRSGDELGAPDGGASARPGDDARDAPAASGRRALIALAIAAVGTVAFAVGLRTALVRLPPERAAGPGAVVPDTTRTRRFTPPAQNQPDEYPRLR